MEILKPRPRHFKNVGGDATVVNVELEIDTANPLQESTMIGETIRPAPNVTLLLLDYHADPEQVDHFDNILKNDDHDDDPVDM